MKQKRIAETAPAQRTENDEPIGMTFYVYILQCSDNSFYTGITTDLDKRTKVHNEGKGAKYTRSRRPVELVYSEPCPTKGEALQRECQIKKWPRSKKETLVAGDDPA